MLLLATRTLRQPTNFGGALFLEGLRQVPANHRESSAQSNGMCCSDLSAPAPSLVEFIQQPHHLPTAFYFPSYEKSNGQALERYFDFALLPTGFRCYLKPFDVYISPSPTFSFDSRRFES